MDTGDEKKESQDKWKLKRNGRRKKEEKSFEKQQSWRGCRMRGLNAGSITKQEDEK